MAERKVRVRFAPSPTGALHIGGVRTALYNYLFARQHGGDLIFRIEDTDSNRFVPGAEEYILESFKWLGIHFDEGVSFGGEQGPYRQSERREIYKKYVQILLENGKAYIAFDTPEELDAKRAEIANFQYDASTRGMMRNSLTMPKEEVDALIAEGKQYVVRFKIEPNEDIHVNDLIRGEVVINSSILDDKVLYKSADELPTYHLANIVEYTVDWFRMLKEKYGKGFPRRTELRNFDTIDSTKVVEANEKLYINREEGFIGTGLKKDEFIANCSDLDDVIIFFRDGRYIITPVTDKKFVGKNILYANVFKKNDKRTIYNVVYRDGKEGTHYIKRFAVTSVVRDREYDVTQGTPDSRIVYFTANPNGEAEVIKVTLKPNPRIRRIIFEEDFSQINIKGRQAMGNILTRNPVHKIALKQRGGSTLGGRKVWFDQDVLRLNYDGRGEYLGEFQSDEQILVVLNNGEFYTSNFDVNNHYEDNIRVLEKYDPHKVWTAVLYDADQQGYPYIKRFCFEASNRKQNYLGENKDSRLILLTDEYYPRLEVVFGGHDNFREPLIVDADEFIAVKGFKAKGKRLTTYTLDTINELEPLRQPEAPQHTESSEEEEAEILDPDHGKSEGDILDELTGQMKLFSNNDDSKEHETT